jgi:hypothetical protein
MRIAQVERHVAGVRAFFLQTVGKPFQIVEGLAENQPAPAAVDNGFGPDFVLVAGLVVPTADRWRTSAFQPMADLVFACHVLDSLLLQPEFQQGDLPEFGTAQWGDVLLRCGQQFFDIVGLE